MKRKFLISIFFIFNCFLMFSQVINDTQILKTDHWIYESLNKLSKEEKITVFNENSMLSVGEIKFYLKKINYENLSETGKQLYNKVNDYLYTNSNLLDSFNKLTKINWMDTSAFKFNINILVNPELYYKSNEDIDWTFNYYYHDNLLSAPLQFGLSNYVTIESVPFIGKSHYGASQPNNFCNVPLCSDDMEFLFMKFAYGSVGKTFDNWGFNLNFSKQGFQIGNTQLASLIYSKNFETDGYFQMNLFSNSFKYSMDIVQVDYQKYLYLHQLEIILLNKIKFALIEGSQVCDSLQVRYMNPFMFMHQMSGWNDYSPDGSPYGEQKFCAYFAWLLECNLIKNTRIYLMYSQNEIQPPWEETSDYGKLYPDSIGLQLGADISIPSKFNGYWNINFEGIYTSPYLYVKHTPEASLFRSRYDNLSGEDIKTWIGSPYGPDSIAFRLGFGYENVEKWKVGFAYIYTMKGEKDFAMFDKKHHYDKKNEDGTSKYLEDDYYNYYPPVESNLESDSYDNLLEDASNMFPSGIIEYRNQFVLNGEYKFNKHIQLNGQAVYTFIFNNKHETGRFDHGIELSISMTYNLF